MVNLQRQGRADWNTSRGWLRLCLVAVLLAGATEIPVLAYTATTKEIPEKAPDRWRIDLGGYRADAFTEASLASTDAGVGAVINFEDVFNMPTTRNVFTAAASWRMMARQYLDFGYVALSRAGENVINQDITWGDRIIKAGGEVSTQFRTQFPYAAWRYDFLQVDKVRISGSAGITYMGIKTSLAANGDIRDVNDPNGPPVSGSLDRDFTINFPVPQAGLQLDWSLSRSLALRMYTRFLYINYSGFRGGVSSRAIRLYWYMTKHFGLSGGIDQESVDIKQYVNGDAKMKLRYEISGLAFYLSFAF
jgi:hypothetical protein